MAGTMTKKKAPRGREHARSIARWDGEGGAARKSASGEDARFAWTIPRALDQARTTVIAPNATVSRTWLSRAWEVASDVVIATAVVWALPLLLAAMAALLGLLLGAL